MYHKFKLAYCWLTQMSSVTKHVTPALCQWWSPLSSEVTFKLYEFRGGPRCRTELYSTNVRPDKRFDNTCIYIYKERKTDKVQGRTLVTKNQEKANANQKRFQKERNEKNVKCLSNSKDKDIEYLRIQTAI